MKTVAFHNKMSVRLKMFSVFDDGKEKRFSISIF